MSAVGREDLYDTANDAFNDAYDGAPDGGGVSAALRHVVDCVLAELPVAQESDVNLDIVANALAESIAYTLWENRDESSRDYWRKHARKAVAAVKEATVPAVRSVAGVDAVVLGWLHEAARLARFPDAIDAAVGQTLQECAEQIRAALTEARP